MSTESSKKEELGQIIIEIMHYDNLEAVLLKIIIPFSEVFGTSNVPDVYAGYERIPFEKRYPLYQTIMRQEFTDFLKNGT